MPVKATEPEEVTDETKEKKTKDKEVEEEVKKIIELKEKEKDVIFTPSFFDYANLLAEQIYKNGKFMFAVANYDLGKVDFKEEIVLRARAYSGEDVGLRLRKLIGFVGLLFSGLHVWVELANHLHIFKSYHLRTRN